MIILSTFQSLVGLVVLFSLVVLLRVILVWNRVRCNRRSPIIPSPVLPPLRTLILLGSGGHTTEILAMTQHLDPSKYHPILYCKATTDTTSLDRLRHSRRSSDPNHHQQQQQQPHIQYNLPRSREVGQSYLSSIGTTLVAMGAALVLVWKARPHLLLCNGPGTCIPVCWAVFLWNVVGVTDCKTVFVESFCRVESLSLTGKILYHFCWADLFVVHWERLKQLYPESVLTTAIMPKEKAKKS